MRICHQALEPQVSATSTETLPVSFALYIMHKPSITSNPLCVSEDGYLISGTQQAHGAVAAVWRRIAIASTRFRRIPSLSGYAIDA